MPSPLDSPFTALERDLGETPPWIWKMAGMAAGIVGALVMRELIDRGRARVTGRGPQRAAGADKPESWPTALIWAGVVGVTGALGRLLAQKAVAKTWRRRAMLRRA